MWHCDACDHKEACECYCRSAGVEKLLAGKIVVLDPGHGGPDSGGVNYGFQESDINLAVGLKLCKKLTRCGAKVVMTRTSDVSLTPVGSTLDDDLQARVDVAEKAGADVFVSLHVEDVPNINLQGIASYFPERRSYELACAIQAAVVEETCAVDTGVSPADFYVLVHNEMPAALIEMGYLSNPEEALYLVDNTYQNAIAEGIFKGIISYLQLGIPSQ